MIIAHRGESFLAPENTLAAINMAWRNGARAVEIDVRLTVDRHAVVIHDRNTRRTGTANFRINKSTLKALMTVDVGVKKAMEWAGERVPTLKQVLSTVPKNGKIIIEIKCGKEIIPYLKGDIGSSGLDCSQVEFISFNLDVLAEAKKQMRACRMLWLLDLDYYLPHWLIRVRWQKVADKVIAHQLDGVNVWAGKLLSGGLVDSFKRQGLLVYTWTVNDEARAVELLHMGVDAITTDRAAWLQGKLLEQAV